MDNNVIRKDPYIRNKGLYLTPWGYIRFLRRPSIPNLRAKFLK